jgi:hypothetical protein
VVEPFVVMFVPGVTPGKWGRIWSDRMPRQPLELRPAPGGEALAALDAGTAHMAFLRDVPASDTLHVIPLYREQPVVQLDRDSPLASADTLTLSEAEALGLEVVPQSVARARSRRDMVIRPVPDAPDSGIGLAWPVSARHPLIDVFVGIVRGRTVNSSRS